jgi:hypothetical protein
MSDMSLFDLDQLDKMLNDVQEMGSQSFSSHINLYESSFKSV